MRRPLRVSRRCLALYAAELLICGVISLPLGSCSIIMPIGAIRTNRRFPPGELETARMKRLPQNARLRLRIAQGDTLLATFKGFYAMSPREYGPLYARWRDGRTNVPDLGETITLVTSKGKTRTGQFKGFGIGSILTAANRFDVRMYPMEDLASIRLASGTELRSDSLLAHATELPMPYEVSLYFRDGVPDFVRDYGRGLRMARIPLGDLRGVEIRRPIASIGGALVGGILIDGAVVAAIGGIVWSVAGNGGSGCQYSGPVGGLSLVADSSQVASDPGSGASNPEAFAAPAR